MKNKNDFEFSYSAPSSEERKEIESIRNTYLPQSSSADTKLQELRKLDSKVKNIPTIVSLVIGIIGTLIFGLGMTMVLEWSMTVSGIIIGGVGTIPLILAHPIYGIVKNKLKKKYSAQILKLSEELLNDENKKV